MATYCRAVPPSVNQYSAYYMGTPADTNGHINPVRSSAWLDHPSIIGGNFSLVIWN